MNNRMIRSKLGVEIILCVACSLGIAFLCMAALRTASFAVITYYVRSTDFQEKKTNEAVEELQAYVNKNNIATTDRDALDRWSSRNNSLLLMVYKDDDMVFMSFQPKRKMDNHMAKEEQPRVPNSQFYEVDFQDGQAQVQIIGFFQKQYNYIADICSLLVAFFIFCLILILFIRKKTNYIKQLADEIKILEGGDLNYAISIKGSDELAVLAQGIDEMRKSFQERQFNEDQARRANSDLITAMSHDLRTPLTTQIGYLDIIEYKKCKDEEQLMSYIHKCREKAYQMKNLSDKLFEYFLAFRDGQEEKQLELESFDGNEVMEQLIEEHAFLLREKGFRLNISLTEQPYHIRINIEAMCRIFDNIFSNLSKYADLNEAIEIMAERKDSHIQITFINCINTDLSGIESTEIGIKNSRNMMEQQNGSLIIYKNSERFKLVLELLVDE